MESCLTLGRSWIPIVMTLASSFVEGVSWMDIERQTQRLEHEKENCYREMRNTPYTLTGLFCNRTWDNVMCWPDTPAGEVAFQNCPDYINGFDHAESATKQCLPSGEWVVSNTTGLPWTNYSSCIQQTQLPFSPFVTENMPKLQMMYTVGYSLSLAALLLAVTIVLSFRRLRCPRNMIHLNLFFAYLIRAGISLMKEILLVNNLGFAIDVTQDADGKIVFIEEDSHWECKMFFTLFNYAIMTSLFWIFIEGLYLMLILTVSVFAEKIKVRWFVISGWGTPLFFVVPWALSRYYLDNSYCWNVHPYEGLYQIIRIPLVVSVVINFLFFINIIRVLITKLTASNCPESRKFRYRRLAKSTLILIPLFAVYYMGFIWLPKMSERTEVVKMYIELIFSSYQGLLVAFLFCFMNNEVQKEIKKRWQRRNLQREYNTSHGHSTRSFYHDPSLSCHAEGGNHIKRDPALTYSAGCTVRPITNYNGHLPEEAEEHVPLQDKTSPRSNHP